MAKNAASSSKDTQLISSISADRLVVKDIFSDDYLFTIPNYQRPYSWEEEHCTQLLDDLHTFAFKDEEFDEVPPYFLGSAVIIKRDNQRAAQIVDGQQRLTTLTILLSCLRYVIDDKEHKDTLSSFIFQKGNKLKGTSETYRLKTRVRDQEFFNDLIQTEDGLERYYQKRESFSTANDAQEQMLTNALGLIEEFKRKAYTQDNLAHLAMYIIQKCIIVIVASTDEDMAFRIFNVLNDRGKDLTIADILKSEILEKIPEKDQDVFTAKWEDCETKLGIDRFKDFFSHLRAIYAKKKAERSVLIEIRDYVNPTAKPKDFIDDVLIPFTDAYSAILNEDYKATSHANEINQQFSRLKRVSHNDWIPSAIFFLAGHAAAPKKVRDFLMQLEKVTLGMEGSRTSLNERIERYAAINERIESKQNLYDQQSLFMLNDEDREYIISTLTSSDLYGRRLVKPVLAKIEEMMNDGSISVNYGGLSIEHVLPKAANGDYWKKRFSTEDRLKWTNNLGNLSLLSIRKNPQASNWDFPDKIEVYFKADGRASNLAMVNDLSQYDGWTTDIIKDRNIALVNHFLTAVGLQKIKTKKNGQD